MTEETPKNCTECGKALPADAPQGLCPQCLMNLGLPTELDVEEAVPTVERNDRRSDSDTPSGDFEPWRPEELAKQFPQLEILELLGQGGMGVVYKARQKQLDRMVALKILPPQISKTKAFTERFGREARSLAKLNHPHIVTVYDFGQSREGLFYFIMEFVDGTDLRRIIQSDQLLPAEALAIVPQVCEALQYAHNEGIVHRDIKPENILLDKKGWVKIADFGLARLLGQPAAAYTLTQAGQRMGTPHYMAPEQIEGAHEVDHRADIYSLGVVFYEMLTGELPLGRFSPPSQKVQVDVRLDHIVLRTLEKEPERRYQHVGEVKTDVEHISSIAAHPAPLSPGMIDIPPDRHSQWRRARLLATLTAWTAVIAGALAYLMPKVWNDWWPWEFEEYGQIYLQPQSGAYLSVKVHAERKRYCWGQHEDRPILKRPWIGAATIYLTGSEAVGTLELDSFDEEWRWTPLVEGSTGSQSEPDAAFVAKWMKAAGIEISKAGVLVEAEALISLVKDAARGVLPGGKSPRDARVSSDTKIGPFVASGLSGGGILIGKGAIGPLDRRYVMAILILVIWLPGLVIIVRRHRRRLSAARATEQRYRVGSIGFWAGILCLTGTAASLLLPWVMLSSASQDYSVRCLMLDNWHGIVSFLALLTVFALCFLTDFFSVGRRWQLRVMVGAGTIIVLVSGIMFWRLNGPPATVRVAEIPWHGQAQMVALVTTVGCSYEREFMRGSFPEDKVPKAMEQHSGLGLWIALVTGFSLLVLGSLTMFQSLRRLEVNSTFTTKSKLKHPATPKAAKISLTVAIMGIVAPFILLLLVIIYQDKLGSRADTLLILCVLLAAGLELIALGTGIVSRKTPVGKAGLIISIISLVLTLLVLTIVMSVREETTKSPPPVEVYQTK